MYFWAPILSENCGHPVGDSNFGVKKKTGDILEYCVICLPALQCMGQRLCKSATNHHNNQGKINQGKPVFTKEKQKIYQGKIYQGKSLVKKSTKERKDREGALHQGPRHTPRHKTNTCRKKFLGNQSFRECMRGLYSHSRNYRKLFLGSHLLRISQIFEGNYFGAYTCRACIRTRANTGKYFWGIIYVLVSCQAVLKTVRVVN